MAYVDYIGKANLMGSVHGSTASPYELWTGEKPYLLTSPMTPFRSVAVAHAPLAQQSIGSPKSILHYAVVPAMGHKGGLMALQPKDEEGDHTSHLQVT